MQIPSTGQGVDAITYNPYMHYVIVHNSKSHSITVIDAKTNKVKGTVEDLGKTEFGASDQNGFYYMTVRNQYQVLSKAAIISLSNSFSPKYLRLNL